MNLNIAKKLTKEYFKKHKLDDWTFHFSNAKRRFGCCYYARKKITISKELTKLNSEEIFVNTLLHEIAHALCGPFAGHMKQWKLKAIEIGCDGKRCWDSRKLITSQIYTVICPKCGHKSQYHKEINVACTRCCVKYNGGRYSKEFKFKFIKNK